MKNLDRDVINILQQYWTDVPLEEWERFRICEITYFNYRFFV